MKTAILKTIAAVLLASAGIYGILAFAFDQPNAFLWHWGGRLALALSILAFLFYAAVVFSAYYIRNKSKEQVMSRFEQQMKELEKLRETIKKSSETIQNTKR